jgi:hypothetical protein
MITTPMEIRKTIRAKTVPIGPYSSFSEMTVLENKSEKTPIPIIDCTDELRAVALVRVRVPLGEVSDRLVERVGLAYFPFGAS